MKKEVKRKKSTSSGSSDKKTIHRSSETGRLVSKKYADSHKATTQRETVQNSEYWRVRGKDDTHRDWGYEGETWVEDYSKSIVHPHRDKIVELLEKNPWSYLLEVGCASGPNLAKIRAHFPDRALFGIDINPHLMEQARATLDQTVDVRLGDLRKLPFSDGQFDVVLADAVLMYIEPEEIDAVMDDLARVAKNILIVDRFTEKDSTASHVWSRDYVKLLEDRGFVVTRLPMSQEDWPTSKNWVRYGGYFLGVR